MTFKKIILFVLLQLAFSKAYCQLQQYYHKIEQVAYAETNAIQLFKKIDSIKQTRRPNDSRVATYFNRDVDFGYKHQRINVKFNGVNSYEINLLTKNDSIYFSSVLYGNILMDEEATKLNRKQNHPKMDTIQVLRFLKLKNTFYNSAKTIADLTSELNLSETYAFYCGDGLPKTKQGKEIEAIVKQKNITILRELMWSICCEEQAYGSAGIKMLQKNKVNIPADVKKLSIYIDKRNSDLIVCQGCFNGLISTAN